ncbi:MAG: cycA 2 [Pedosphaera sp.]|nr:cycA 2 [Pedosphaera sp.]
MSPDPKKPLIKATDEAEPKAERSAAPVALVVLLALMVFGGMVYLGNNAGGFNAQVYGPFKSHDEVKGAQPVSKGGEALVLGKKVYETCAACHMPTGVGSPTVNAPPLAGSEWVVGGGPNRIIRIVLNGLAGPIEVNGKAYGAGAMPAFKDSFSDEQIAAVLTYVRQEWGNKADPVKPETVKAIRAETASKGDNWAAPDLLQVSDK